MDSIFRQIKCPGDIKNFSLKELEQLTQFLREEIISTISKTGGHLASSLGTVELTVALHSVFDSPKDKIIWDVGHQCYAHKLLTGRMEEFCTIRQYKGLSGFTRLCESCHDPFGAGHSSTSISAALGFAAARDLNGEYHDVVAVIGDGAMTGGLAYEGLNNGGQLEPNLIVILNDNEMSISKNVGGMARHLSNLRTEPKYIKIRHEIRKMVKNIPLYGQKMLETAESIEDRLTTFLLTMSRGVIFEGLGFMYLGPYDGHDMRSLLRILKRVKQMKGPRLVHFITQKGKGYPPAEKDSARWHGTLPFHIETGNGTEAAEKDIPSYSQVLCNTLIHLAQKDSRIVAITAAMPDGTGLMPFKEKFPDRFFDVGIAEQHAATFAAGLAAGGARPIVVLYSTFLQRAYDQLIHDVCLQKLPVIFAIDRGGLVGEDGPTHHGAFDFSFLTPIPNLIVMSPRDENEMQHMVKSAFDYTAPAAIRYSRGRGVGVPMDPLTELATLPLGKGEIMHPGKDLTIMAIGNMVYPSILAAEKLGGYGIKAGVINMRFAKPLDEELIISTAEKTRHVVTVEENAVRGGFGSSVLEVIHRNEIGNCVVQNVGLPDIFVEQGNVNVLREKLGLTSDGIVETIKKKMQVST
jgi:1-deoxy-D-xylulose-5-phosphate synthase